MRDERLREWYRNRPPRPAGSPHPAPEALERLAWREGPEPERLATLNHVTQCGTCREEFELLRALAQAEGPAVRRFVVPKWLPLAAAVVLAVGGTWVWRRGREPDAERGGAPGLRLADSALTLGASVRFVWRPAGAASRYRFELAAEDGRLVFTAEGADTAVAVPDSVRLAPGRYHWSVAARLPSGEPVTGGGTVAIR